DGRGGARTRRRRVLLRRARRPAAGRNRRRARMIDVHEPASRVNDDTLGPAIVNWSWIGTGAYTAIAILAFGFLLPVYGLGLCGLWGARHGTFADRPPPPHRRPRGERRRRPTP